jgi:hypothetical protein
MMRAFGTGNGTPHRSMMRALGTGNGTPHLSMMITFGTGNGTPHRSMIRARLFLLSDSSLVRRAGWVLVGAGVPLGRPATPVSGILKI